MIPIARPIIGEEEKTAVLQVMESGILAQGPAVRKFEEAFAEWLGVKEAVAVSSGTSALSAALLAHGVGPGDEVITTPFSFIASANSILFTGARPVFVDVLDSDFNINPDLIEARVTSQTKAVIPVHLYGHPCRLDDIVAIAERHNLAVVEDACQAHGAMIGDRVVGSFGTSCFSFYPTKNMTTGEGGMIATNDSQIAEIARCLRDQGQTRRYRHELLGYNWRMTDIGAAIGLVQLRRLAEANERRRANASLLTRELKGVIPPTEHDGYRHVYHQYTVRVPGHRDDLLAHLQKRGVGAEVYYPTPIHWQPIYRQLGYKETLPVAERLSSEVLSLPVHPSLSEGELEIIVAETNRFFKEGK